MNAQHSNKTDQWFTPDYILEAARSAVGGISLDPCSSPAANRRVKAVRYITKDMCGIRTEWVSSHSIGGLFINPPSGRHPELKRPYSKLFWEKLMGLHSDTHKRYCFTGAVFLCYSIEQLQSLQNIDSCLSPVDFPMCIPRKRIRFINEGNKKNSPPHAQAVIYVPLRDNDEDRFFTAFENIGALT